MNSKICFEKKIIANQYLLVVYIFSSLKLNKNLKLLFSVFFIFDLY